MASGSALIFDEEMSRYKLLWKEDRESAIATAVPERLTVSYEALKTHGVTQRCKQLPVRQATEQEILLAHSEEYLEAVKQTPKMSVEELMAFSKQYSDVYFHQNIYHCAKLAVGATLQLVESVMKREVRNGMALVRPPGHHSQRSAANGFCVFNNVAIAALHAKKNYNLNRVLIVDWDIHHGQGVQYCFEEDPSVLYFSWHRYENQTFWPNLPESDYTSVGKGKGRGFNINLPWNKVGMTNSEYLAAFFHVLLPVAYEFDPELVLVSAGFDSAIGDPEGEMCAIPEIFAHLTQLLMPLAAGKMCVVLEGGYNLTSLAQSVCQTVQTLLGDPAPRLSGLTAACERKVLLVQVCAEETEEECVNRLSLCLREGESFTAGFMHAVLSLILPLAYEFNPCLVLGVFRDSGAKTHLTPVWGHLTSLLQGLAGGQMLTVLQGYDKDLLEVTVSALSGAPVPPLGPLGAPKPADVQMMEKQRQRLQKRWSLVQECWGLLR
ncbi:polyamine deacetylase HDAC10 [Sinocyclocheilus grahami]|uniref:polyamine deacetylase HDAC10 n=1 Tax=Sinocyclocheilus grahami TaxID=75366 RepID=UPI0007ACD0F7|nr:PREDICTED: histone deacetylase 10 [Sinocyclocheilus grahami]